MTRTIPPTLAPLLELLELERPSVVTVERLAEMARTAGVAGRLNMIVRRLASRGWLIPTGARGTWEFVPADRAGPYGSQDPWLPLRGILGDRPDFPVRVALGSALWLLDLADRAPDRPEIAVPPGFRLPLTLAPAYRVTRFAPVLPAQEIRGLPVEAPASLLVHLAERPADVRSWEAVLAALGGLVERVNAADFAAELSGRRARDPGAVRLPGSPVCARSRRPPPAGAWRGHLVRPARPGPALQRPLERGRHGPAAGAGARAGPAVIGDRAQLTPGYVARHLPPASRVGAGIARLDIAQDFLLAHLAAQGVFDLVAFKGGTALRKLFAGGQGRFSIDIDLAAEPGADGDRRGLTELVASYCTTTLGPFQYAAQPQRDRYTVRVTTGLGPVEQTIKLEIGPPCWLPPKPLGFIPHLTHQRYGFPLPALPCMRLEEILAEKVARLTRQSTARDAYDLVWVARTSPWSQFDRALVRRLAMLKVWADNHGLGAIWRAALHPAAFDAARWLASRGAHWDDEQIGLLAHPAPTLAELGADLGRYYGWLANLDADEACWAQADPRDRASVLAALHSLPGERLAGLSLY